MTTTTLPRQTCCVCLRTVGTLPDGTTIPYDTYDAYDASRRWHYCRSNRCAAQAFAEWGPQSFPFVEKGENR